MLMPSGMSPSSVHYLPSVYSATATTHRDSSGKFAYVTLIRRFPDITATWTLSRSPLNMAQSVVR